MNSIVIGNIGKFLRRITLTTFIIAPRCLSFFSLLAMRNVVRISDMAVMTIRQILNISSVNQIQVFFLVPRIFSKTFPQFNAIKEYKIKINNPKQVTKMKQPITTGIAITSNTNTIPTTIKHTQLSIVSDKVQLKVLDNLSNSDNQANVQAVVNGFEKQFIVNRIIVVSRKRMQIIRQAGSVIVWRLSGIVPARQMFEIQR